MYKKLFLLICLIFFNFICFAQDMNDLQGGNCEKCPIEDDEYCIYNQCYFDRHYRNLKKNLCLTNEQESQIDDIYKFFKYEMEDEYSKYCNKKNKILEMIDKNDICYKKELKALKKLEKQAKERYDDFVDNVKEQLNKKQLKCFRKITKQEKRIFKKMLKYAQVYKLPGFKCSG